MGERPHGGDDAVRGRARLRGEDGQGRLHRPRGARARRAATEARLRRARRSARGRARLRAGAARRRDRRPRDERRLRLRGRREHRVRLRPRLRTPSPAPPSRSTSSATGSAARFARNRSTTRRESASAGDAGGRHRRRDRRRQLRVPPGQGGRERRRPRREGRTDERLHAPRGRPRDAVQPVADDDALPPLQRPAVRGAGRVRAGRARSGSRRAATACSSCGAASRARTRSGWTQSSSARRRRCGSCPAITDRELYGAVWMPGDGYVDPHIATYAVASAARELGVEIRTHTLVTGIDVRDGRVRAVETENGEIECETVVNAAGMWAPRVAAMVGAFACSIPVDHQHIALHAVEGHRAAARHAVLPRHRQPRSTARRRAAA